MLLPLHRGRKGKATFLNTRNKKKSNTNDKKSPRISALILYSLESFPTKSRMHLVYGVEWAPTRGKGQTLQVMKIITKIDSHSLDLVVLVWLESIQPN